MAHRTGAGELHRARRAHVVEHAAGAAGAVETGEGEHLAGDEPAGLSAFICPANAGAITAPAATAPNTKRASML